jgi:mono/diheme cytochrome c family protein
MACQKRAADEGIASALNTVGMKRLLLMSAAVALPGLLSGFYAPAFADSGDANAGGKLVQANGCEGCHGVGLKGAAMGPALYGLERKLTTDQIANAIKSPKSPMPNFGFSGSQIADLVAYISSLDGGASNSVPVVTFNPAVPRDIATISIRFPGTPPKSVTVLPVMQMGTSTMQTRQVMLTQSSTDPHTFAGRVVFSMGGPWTVRVQYDGRTMNVPLNVGQ